MSRNLNDDSFLHSRWAKAQDARVAEHRDWAHTLQELEDVRRELAAIDRELYGETQPVGYNPDRVVTIQAIKKLSASDAELEARGQLEVAEARIAELEQLIERWTNGPAPLLARLEARIAELEAERDRLRETVEECAAYFRAQKCKGAPYLMIAEALAQEHTPGVHNTPHPASCACGKCRTERDIALLNKEGKQ